MGLLIAGLAYTPMKMYGRPLDTFTIGVAALWNVYNLIVVSAAVLAAVDRRQQRTHHRHERSVRVLASPISEEGRVTEGFAPVEGFASDISQAGVRFIVNGVVSFPRAFSVTLLSSFGTRAEIEVDLLGRRFSFADQQFAVG